MKSRPKNPIDKDRSIGEGHRELLADRGAYEDFDADAYMGGKGFGFVQLQQLFIEHLLGAR